MKKEFVDDVSLILAQKKLLKFNDVYALHDAFYNKSDISFEDFLLEEGIIDKPALLEALSDYYHLPALDVVGEFFEHHMLLAFPKTVMLRYLFIPYHRENDNIWVVAANPNDPELRTVIGKYTDYHVNFMVGYAQDIIDAIREYYDQSITYQPNDIANQLMERSMQEVHPTGELVVEDHPTEEIPEIWEETIDDYESK